MLNLSVSSLVETAAESARSARSLSSSSDRSKASAAAAQAEAIAALALAIKFAGDAIGVGLKTIADAIARS